MIRVSAQPPRLSLRHSLAQAPQKLSPHVLKANLFTLLENCRQAGVEPEAYLIDLIAALADRSPHAIADWLPHAWQRRRTDGIAAN